MRDHLPRLAQRRGLDPGELALALHLMPVAWQSSSIYSPFRAEAQRRMAGRDPDDWPVVALALALDLPIWSQDKDLSVSGVPVYTTGQLLDTLRSRGTRGA
ncbi:MAG: PIN domain-containing protein [Dehalococcoidia bacterium]